MTRIRRIIGALGLALIGTGIVFLVTDLRIAQIVGLMVWLAAAVVLHDAVLVPIETAIDLLLRRVGRRLPRAVTTVVEAGLAVGALLTALVVPELVAQARGPRNPTVLPGDYGVRLAVLWLVIVVAVAVTSTVIVWRARRSARRP
ncbi:hypothetical protein [Leifsonia soli]|uniref:Type IV secretory pathway VirB3-like protein n=1 Tax=Leifsonia soli TaxID=582665 RepID=A0A852T252_9MICO|nr:hypothetical protein [Leifsonia soli]NYD74965.1 type IV secretory pathway VirB3-like protein [Leifsonia soli]